MKSTSFYMVKRVIHKKSKKKEKKPPQSNSIRYMNSIKNRGPKSVTQSRIYEKWTKAIQASMEKENIWPTGLEEWTYKHVAEYIHRLQKEFWKKLPSSLKKAKAKHYGDNIDFLRKDPSTTRFLRDIFKYIFNKVRNHFRKFGLFLWKGLTTPAYTFMEVPDPTHWWKTYTYNITFETPLAATLE